MAGSIAVRFAMKIEVQLGEEKGTDLFILAKRADLCYAKNSKNKSVPFFLVDESTFETDRGGNTKRWDSVESSIKNENRIILAALLTLN